MTFPMDSNKLRAERTRALIEIRRRNRVKTLPEADGGVKLPIFTSLFEATPIRIIEFKGHLWPLAADVAPVVTAETYIPPSMRALGANVKLKYLGLGALDIVKIPRLELGKAYGASSIKVCAALGMASNSPNLGLLTERGIQTADLYKRGLKKWFADACKNARPVNVKLDTEVQ